MILRSPKVVFFLVFLAAVLAFVVARSVTAAEPHIEYIVLDRTNNYVVIHYSLVKNSIYYLEATYDLKSGVWTNLYTFGPFDFDGAHIAYADYMTSTQRFYRLRATMTP